MEDQLNKIGFGKSKKKESMEEAPGSCKILYLYILYIITVCKFYSVAKFQIK